MPQDSGVNKLQTTLLFLVASALNELTGRADATGLDRSINRFGKQHINAKYWAHINKNSRRRERYAAISLLNLVEVAELAH
jgi:hypothetical protein